MVKNRVTAGIGVALIIGLMFIVFGTKGENKHKSSQDFKSVKKFISEDKLDEARKLIDEIAAKNPDSNIMGKLYFDLAVSYEKDKEIVKARDIYGLVWSKYHNVDNILEVQENLGRLNIEILFSPIVTDKDVRYKIKPGDTLSKIAKKFGTTIALIKTSNSLKSDTIRANSRLKVSKAGYKMLVDRSQNTLTLLSLDGAVFKVYRVATGENNSTPLGTFKIVNKIKDPVWYTEGAVIPSESPDNLLGSRWLGFSEKGYGIHGTVAPESIGGWATKGCIRMLNSEVEELYVIVPIGVEVTILD